VKGHLGSGMDNRGVQDYRKEAGVGDEDLGVMYGGNQFSGR